MASRKGITLTIGILVAITAASFLVWLIPQNNQQNFFVSDFENNLNNVKEIHKTLELEIEKEFDKFLKGEISSDDYTNTAEISSSQINSQIIQIIDLQIPTEWQTSYNNYLEALRKFNSIIRESIIIASLKNGEKNDEKIQEKLETIKVLKEESLKHELMSDQNRP